jgi:peptide-N4-(N-acetyl-beta-glucosaminyl)asparagine amidase
MRIPLKDTLTSQPFTPMVSRHLQAVSEMILIVFLTAWKRKLAYCIAFSRDGATDVTRRYVRNFTNSGSERARAPEPVLLYILDEIRALRRRDMSKNDKFRLKGEDMREDQEMSRFIALSLATELVKSLDKNSDVHKAEEARLNGESSRRHSNFVAIETDNMIAEANGVRVRGPNGATGAPNPRNPHDHRQ